MKTSALAFLVVFGFTTATFALTPPPGGGYPNETTALGDDALLSLTTGSGNTALGFQALHSSTVGSSNTAIGSLALHANTTGESNTANGNLALTANTTGKPFTVRYEEVNAMLLNEFLKAHRQLDEQRDEIDSLKASMTKLQATLEKMSARVAADE